MQLLQFNGTCPILELLGLSSGTIACLQSSWAQSLHWSADAGNSRLFSVQCCGRRVEQAYIDAYEGEGWKGANREKVKPDGDLKQAHLRVGAHLDLLRLAQPCRYSTVLRLHDFV